MAVLVDTSVLGRLANRTDSAHAVAQAAVAELHRQGEALHVTAQDLIEFRNFATRPMAANGLGLTPATAEGVAAVFEATFPMLEETPAIYPAWRAIVDAIDVVGKQVHDARLVAVCHVYGVTRLLTFNVAHFTRLATTPPSIVVLDPAAVSGIRG
jgi:predicted nucleic acid-binding protein